MTTSPSELRLVVLETRCAAPTKVGRKRYREYTVACMKDSLARGEAPYASQVVFDQPGLLDDEVPDERRHGMEAGFAWGAKAEICAVYVDHGISSGMREGIARAKAQGIDIEYRSLAEGP